MIENKDASQEYVIIIQQLNKELLQELNGKFKTQNQQ